MEFIEMLGELGVDPQETIRRFCQNEQLLNKYLRKFLEDDTYERLKAAVGEENQNHEEILRMAHTLKGVSANFGMKTLSGACAKMVDAIRADEFDGLAVMFQDVDKEYHRIYEIIDRWEKQ